MGETAEEGQAGFDVRHKRLLCQMLWLLRECLVIIRAVRKSVEVMF